MLQAALPAILLNVDICICWKLGPCGWVRNTVAGNTAGNIT